jgi:hypothetical protein
MGDFGDLKKKKKSSKKKAAFDIEAFEKEVSHLKFSRTTKLTVHRSKVARTTKTETETAMLTSTGNSVTMSLVATTMTMRMTLLPSWAMKHGLAQTEITHIPK